MITGGNPDTIINMPSYPSTSLNPGRVVLIQGLYRNILDLGGIELGENFSNLGRIEALPLWFSFSPSPLIEYGGGLAPAGYALLVERATNTINPGWIGASPLIRSGEMTPAGPSYGPPIAHLTGRVRAPPLIRFHGAPPTAGYPSGSGAPYGPPISHLTGLEEISIDIPAAGNGFTDPAVVITHQQQWKDYIERLITKKAFESDDHAVLTVTSEAAVGIVVQALGGLITSVITSPSSCSPIVAAATVGGLGFTVAGIALRRRLRRKMSRFLMKTGALSTAGAIVTSIAIRLPPVVAWTVGPVAFLLAATAVALT